MLRTEPCFTVSALRVSIDYRGRAVMGWPFDVYGWTFGINPVTNREEWHYVAIYQGRSWLYAHAVRP